MSKSRAFVAIGYWLSLQMRGVSCRMLRRQVLPGCSSAWLERLLWEQEAVGSNPITPIRRQLPEGMPVRTMTGWVNRWTFFLINVGLCGTNSLGWARELLSRFWPGFSIFKPSRKAGTGSFEPATHLSNCRKEQTPNRKDSYLTCMVKSVVLFFFEGGLLCVEN